MVGKIDPNNRLKIIISKTVKGLFGDSGEQKTGENGLIKRTIICFGLKTFSIYFEGDVGFLIISSH